MKTEINRFYCGDDDKLQGMVQILTWLIPNEVFHTTTFQLETNRKKYHKSGELFNVTNICAVYRCGTDEGNYDIPECIMEWR